MANNTNVAVKAEDKFTGVATIEERSEYVGRGSENVSTDDLAIPRLKLLQMINPEVEPGNPKQVDGAQAGMIMNSVTEELYTSLFLINLSFTKKIVVWRKRKLGGGMVGSYDTEQEALDALEEQGLAVKDHDISENPTHLVLLLDDEGNPKSVALLDMPGVKVKKSRIWNTLINDEEKQGNPRFGCVWQLGVVSESNSSGNFFNYDISLVAHAPDELYEQAVEMYSALFASKTEAA
ncbi:hypothetical protein PESP_a1725 [Pseudoalteromonas espejiana DSM 9414]|uniref:Uncharacterized protein n=1 Tax=Pseudoalteromonas espejiana TaxID=28107 RepID=A0A510XUF6_9GAMM|nr:hypothetical protein [Pseudoalteromonas espejiana]ASM49803.1 hypothetical protein PESP_a1725 [Pseudoalteromonas espejiana DSM 9414]GEK54207.1 hypothetical protein PES01_10520 [Pseudoalteromonas espejiana]